MQRYAVTTATAATTNPVTLDDVKVHLNISTTADDDLLWRAINWATDKLQADTGRQYVNATINVYYDEFPCDDETPLRLPRSPVNGTSTVVVTYVNSSAGTTSTWSSSLYQVDRYSEPPRLQPAYGQSWPTPRDQPNAVKVAYTCGYGSTDSQMPAIAKNAILAAIAEQYRYREVGAWDDDAEMGWQRAIALLRYE